MNLSSGRPLSRDGTRSDPPTESLQLLRRNRTLLGKRFSDHVKQLMNVDLGKARFTTLPGGAGSPTLIGFREGGQLLGLDDPADPVGSQLRWFDHFDLSNLTHAILLGFGAGHIHERLSGPIPHLKKLTVIEPHADLLAVACATYDLSQVIENPQVEIWNPEDGYQAALWTLDWLTGFSLQEGDRVGFLLNPFFLRSAPEFLVDYWNWLQIKDDKFYGVKTVLESKFPPSPGSREDWEWGFTLTGVGALAGLGQGLIGILVAGDMLSETEKELLTRGDPTTRLVLGTAGLSPDIANTIEGFVIRAQDSIRAEISPQLQVFAEMGAACQNPLPASTVIFRTEIPPQRDQILSSASTLGGLRNKGTLIKQLHPLGTLIDLARHLGCRDLLLMGVDPQVKTPGIPDFESVGLSEQMRQSGCDFSTLNPKLSEWLPEVRLVRRVEDLPRSSRLKKGSLSEAVESVAKRPPTLPAPRISFDRSFSWRGSEIVTQAGVLKKPSEENLFEILFRENLVCLKECHPRMAELVEEKMAHPSPQEAYQLGVGPEGFPHLAIVKDSRRIALSPLSGNPWKDVREAESWTALFSECANLVVGIGLGFHIEAILERTTGGLMIWEPMIDRLMAAMHLRNLAPLFKCERIDWLLGKTPLEAAGHFVDTRTQQMYYHPMNWEPYIEPGMRQANAGYAKEFLDHFHPRVNEIRSMRNEAISSARKWAVHFLRNTPRKAEAASLKLLRDRFKGFPAIIVSAGPSLDETAPLLNEVRDRALIFAVDTSFRVVADRDIDRHFVLSVDQKDATLLHFANRTPRDTDILIATSGAPPLVWDLFKGPSFFGEFETGSGEKSKILSWIANSLGLEEEYLFRGNSVAISSIGAAHVMGCDPIILVGQDLSVLPDRTHAAGTIYPTRPGLTQSPNNLKVPAIGGGEVETTQWLKNIQNNLEYTLMKHRLNVINATARGATIRGTTEMRFQEVLDTLLGDPLPIFQIVSEIYSDRGRPTIENMHREIDAMRAELKSIQSRGMAQLNELTKLQKRIDRGDFPQDCPKRFQLLQQSLVDIGFEDIAFQRFQDFIYREGNTFSEQHVRVHRAKDPRIKLRLQVERMIPLLESLGPGLDDALGELETLQTELRYRFDE